MGEKGVLKAGNIAYDIIQKWQLNMASSSRRMSTTLTSGGWGSSQSDLNNSAKYYCNCGYEAVMYKIDDNYRRRYLVCPLEVNCDSFILKLFNFEALVVFYNSSTVLTCVVDTMPSTSIAIRSLTPPSVKSESLQVSATDTTRY